MVRVHSSLAVLLVLAALASPTLQAQGPAPVGRLLVFIQGRQMGTEQATVTSTAEGWVIRGTGRIGAPVNLTTTRFEARYDRQWQPIALEVDAVLRGQPMLMRSTFSGGVATTELTEAGLQSRKTDAVSADALLLPNLFFCSYEALALRLHGITVPSELHAYIAPQIEIPLKVTASNSERIQTAGRAVSATRYEVTLVNPSGPVPSEVWIDQDGRLLRLVIPSQALEVAREDVAAVSSRIEKLGRDNDEQVRIPASGFTLAATISKPASAPRPPAPGKAPAYKLPAIILVAGSGPLDRDEVVAGIPLFAQLANSLADAGFIVVRYDKRGVGQSGGREESATLQDYAEDARAVAAFLAKRKDVDRFRVAAVGMGEGGLVALQVAAIEKDKLDAVAVLGTPGTKGTELVLEQQRSLLDRMKLPEAEKQNRIDLQQRIHAAVLGDITWDGIPPAYRRQADTPWFRSFLLFDPIKAIGKAGQPILIAQGELDRQIAARHGELLYEAARARKKAPGADLATIPGVNHLFLPAETGDVDEYATLPDKQISPKLLDVLVPWLRMKLHVGAPGAGR